MLRGRPAIGVLALLLMLAVAGRILVDSAFSGAIAIVLIALVAELRGYSPRRRSRHLPDEAPVAMWWRAQRARRRGR